jgi:peptidyl-prolyl cis-trans isomerase SurA
MDYNHPIRFDNRTGMIRREFSRFRLWAIAAMLAMGLGASVSAYGQGTAQRIVAVVNDDIISGLDLKSRSDLIILSSQLPNTDDVRQRIQPQVLRTLIDDRLKLQEARRQKISVSDAEINDAIAEIEKRNQMKRGDMFGLLDHYQIDRSTLRLQIEAELAWRKVVQDQMRAGITIGDDMVDDAIRRIDSNKGKPEYLVSEIFLAMSSGKSAAEVRDLAQRLHQQIVDGANFSELARSFSQSASAAQGGNLGWVLEDQLDPGISDAVKAMPSGQISDPLQGVDGFYIIGLRGKRLSEGLPSPDITLTLQQVFVPLAGADHSERTQLAQNIAAQSKSCSDMEAAGKKLGSPQSGQLANVKLASLPPAIRDAIKDLQNGQTSGPIPVGDGLVVLMVCERKGDVANAEVRARVENMLLNEKGELLARRLMRDLYRQAFVDIRK